MQKRPYAVCDTECYWNYWSIGFRDYHDPSLRWKYYFMPGQTLDVEPISQLLRHYTIITFNGGNYDDPMITLALHGATNKQLKEANDLIIVGGMKPWVFYDHYRISRPVWMDSIDISEVAPGVKISLKVYSGRTNSAFMQDLPLDYTKPIDPSQIPLMLSYQDNDVDNTADLATKIWNRIELREQMNEMYSQYRVDLRSKSDAQIAETLIKAMLDYRDGKPFWPHHTEFHYQPLAFLQFQTPQLQRAYETILSSPFLTSDKEQTTDEVDENGNKIKTGIIIPKAIKDIRLIIGGTAYKFGYGGLHSQEHSVSHHAIEGVCTLSDHDVTSYYPRIMLNQGLYPKQLGPGFVQVFNHFVEGRIDAKQRHKHYAKEKAAGVQGYDWDHWIKHYYTFDEGGKIIINGTFGKLGSKYSILFAPDLMVQVTITGQLSLLLLIEMLELNGISVVSANTDGIVVKCPVALEWLRDQVMDHWMKQTNFNLEASKYKALYSRDVNNYIAIGLDGKAKTKGVFAEAGVKKSPANTVCVDAVIAYLTEGVPVEQTIYACRDITRFLTVRQVNGGAQKNGEVLGKAVRWYYGTNETGVIQAVKNGNRVPKSEGAVPLMRLPQVFPADVDYQWYVREATAMLTEIAAL